MDALPQPPVAMLPSISQAQEDKMGTFDTVPDVFQVFRRYPACPISVPDEDCELADYSNEPYESIEDTGVSSTDVQAIISPCPNISNS